MAPFGALVASCSVPRLVHHYLKSDVRSACGIGERDIEDLVAFTFDRTREGSGEDPNAGLRSPGVLHLHPRRKGADQYVLRLDNKDLSCFAIDCMTFAVDDLKTNGLKTKG